MKSIITAVISVICLVFPHLTALAVVNAINTLPKAPEKHGSDCIHFMNTGSSDAILIESDGHFALVDAGEDADNPRGFDWLVYEGQEQKVLSYLKSHAADANGKVHLDFVVGTHAHSDHIGGFDTVILDPDVTIDRAYLKEYDSSKINEYEIENWDNQEVYDQMINALAVKNIPVEKPGPAPFTLGNFKVTLINTDDPEKSEKVGENDNSLGVLLEKNGSRVFLAGDMDDYSGDETHLAPEIGKIDLLKVGHHSNPGSSSETFIKTLLPDACVVTTGRRNANVNILAGIIKICRNKNIYTTGNENGVLAVIGDSGDISYYGGIFDNLKTD
ncbi:MAG: MBL fold metallo-hydrolase [Clostridia bacterium]|nr:MBL fold metallo-hydrolase [Clostridia bacterium]